jgi:hypothetical protein
MLRGFSDKATAGILLAIFVMTGAGYTVEVTAAQGGNVLAIGTLVWEAGFCVFLWGCVQLVERKGYSRWYGLFALLMGPGLIIILFLRDKHGPVRRADDVIILFLRDKHGPVRRAGAIPRPGDPETTSPPHARRQTPPPPAAGDERIR